MYLVKVCFGRKLFVEEKKQTSFPIISRNSSLVKKKVSVVIWKIIKLDINT